MSVSSLLKTPKGRLAAGAAGLLVVLLAGWLLGVSPQKSKATDLKEQTEAASLELAQKRGRRVAAAVVHENEADRGLARSEGAERGQVQPRRLVVTGDDDPGATRRIRGELRRVERHLDPSLRPN